MHTYKHMMISAVLITFAFEQVGAASEVSTKDSTRLMASLSKGPPVAPAGKESIWSLEQCVKRAIANSKKIEAEQHRVTMLVEQQDQLWWAPFSNFSLSGTFSMVPDKCVDLTGGMINACPEESDVPADDDFFDKEWGPTLHVDFRGLLPIPTSNKFSKAKEALREATAAKRAQLPTIKHQIAFDVHRAYHAIVGAREMMYTLSKGREHISKAKKKIESNLEKQEGTTTQIDLLKIKIFESRINAMEKQVIQIEESGLAALRFLVGAKTTQTINIPDSPQEVVHRDFQSLDAYKQTAIDRRPEFEALRHGVNALRAKVKLTKAAFVPELAFVFRLRAGYTPGVEIKKQRVDSETGATIVDENGEPTYEEASVPFVNKNSYNYGSIVPSVGLVMNVPLNFGLDIHKVREAKAELKALVADKTYAMEGIILEVETTYIEVTAILGAINELKKSKRTVKGWLNAAAQNHAVGLGTIKELQDALKEYFAIMAELHQKVSEYNIALAKLDKVTGVVLDEK